MKQFGINAISSKEFSSIWVVIFFPFFLLFPCTEKNFKLCHCSMYYFFLNPLLQRLFLDHDIIFFF